MEATPPTQCDKKSEGFRKLVENTWEQVLDKEGDIPKDWIHSREVLVGMRLPPPYGTRDLSPTLLRLRSVHNSIFPHNCALVAGHSALCRADDHLLLHSTYF